MPSDQPAPSVRDPRPLVVHGPRSATYDFGLLHPLSPRRFGPGISLLEAFGADRFLAPEPADDRGPAAAPPGGLHRVRQALLGRPGPTSRARHRPGRRSRLRRHARGRGGGRRRLALRPWRRSSRGEARTPSTRAAACTTRWPTGRPASASTTTSRSPAPWPATPAIASSTSTSTSTTATASRRSSGTTPAS